MDLELKKLITNDALKDPAKRVLVRKQLKKRLEQK